MSKSQELENARDAVERQLYRRINADSNLITSLADSAPASATRTSNVQSALRERLQIDDDLIYHQREYIRLLATELNRVQMYEAGLDLAKAVVSPLQ